ncbi:MAG TPA: ribose-5-phosphate isomerase [Mycobacteriales bacterium]|jgi:ribose 5-phosphate isomerase B|nr:ribose-5-phosphate isomerase [Mycobacteriales bacterium]
MRVFLGTDHAGYELKEHLRAVLAADGHDVADRGAFAYDAEDDYPSFCIAAARDAVAEGAFAVVLGGSGNGEQIAANKVPGARAALCWSTEIARLAREHNDANVCSLGARFLSPDEAVEVVRTFLGTAFSGDDRHVRRIGQIGAYETSR